MSNHFETSMPAYMIQEPVNMVIFRPLQSLSQPKNGEPCEEASVSVDVGHRTQVETHTTMTPMDNMAVTTPSADPVGCPTTSVNIVYQHAG